MKQRIEIENLAALNVHLLLNPDLMAGIIIGVAYKQGVFREEAEQPQKTARGACRG